MRWFWNQVQDAMAYWVLPFIAFSLPAGPARGLARWLSRRQWLFRVHVDRALANASAVEPITAPEAWQATFRLVRFLDAVDCWHGRFSSDRRIERSLVSGPAHWPRVETLVLLGTHLGPSSLFLRRVAAAGYRPRFVFRDLPIALKREAPVYHAYLRWRIAYLERVCAGREIRVPGGRGKVEAALKESGTALILLMDAPAAADQGKSLKVRGRSLQVDTRGLGLMAAGQATGAFFAMYWDDELGRRVIEVAEPERLENPAVVLEAFEGFLDDWLQKHPAQWQLWLTAQPVLNEPSET